jgi:hypothetical protein
MSWLLDLARSTCDPKQACDVWAYGHNLLFEERLSEDRFQAYAKHCADLKVPVSTSWNAAHTAYVQNRIKVGKPFSAETFHVINDEAQTEAVGDDAFLLRCEDLRRPLQAHGVSAKDLAFWLGIAQGRFVKGSKGITKANARAKLANFLDDWNGLRKDWPAFCAFEHELGGAEALAKGPWAETLRNRLGMAHYDGTLAVPVALMRVPVAQVRAAAVDAKAAPLARPTLLDGEMNRYYYPTPAGFAFGSTLHLDPALCGQQQTAEILAFPVEYRVEHLVAVGTMNSPLPAHCLRNLRNRHLEGLRTEPGGDVFGDIIESHDCHGGAPCR